LVTFVLILHVLVALVMILVVLLQAGKGAEMGAAFGGTSKTLFGPRGAAGPLAKVTAVAAVLFMLTSLYLTWASKHTGGSLLKHVTGERPAAEKTTQPASPLTGEKQPADTGAGGRGVEKNVPGGQAAPVPGPGSETPEGTPVEETPPGGG